MLQYLLQVESDGTTYTAQELYERINKVHVSLGGEPPIAKSPQKEASKAVALLRDQGYYEQRGTGYWCRTEKAAPDEASREEELGHIEVSIGEGDQTIYAWYLPAYRKLAALENRESYPIKIGRTEGESIERITDSAGYSPEQFKVALELRCDDAANWERLLHSYLKLCGRHLADAIGTEWFETNPDELEKFISDLLERIEECKS